MAKIKAEKSKKMPAVFRNLGQAGLFLLKVPYYLGKGTVYAGKGIYHLAKKTDEVIEERKEKKKREKMNAKYEDFEVIHAQEGDFEKWFNKIKDSDSKIGVILGARGSGKTAFGIKFIENVYANDKCKCYALGFNEKEMPSWIEVVDDISQIKNDAFVLIDEGGVLFNSRDSMSNANKLLSDLILVARHKNLSILFISQNSSNLDINILRQADFLALKPSSLLQKEFERKIVQKIYDGVSNKFEKFKDKEGLVYIYGDIFKGFVSNPLPSFWDTGISKSFR